MKKVLSALVISAMIFGAGSVMADSFTAGAAGNTQTQVQDFNAVNLGPMGGVSTISQDQAGLGGSVSDGMSAAGEGQIQGENTNLFLSNGSATHVYNSTAVTEGASLTAGGGIGAHVETQTVDGGIATVGDANGTASVSGSAMGIGQGVAAGGAGLAGAESGAVAGYGSAYEYNNVGMTSNISQTGSQESVMATGAGGANGGGIAGLEATQVGGTAALNNGAGTSMGGAGLATGSITTVNGVATGPGGVAVAGSLGAQGQVHSYTQASNSGAGQTQFASGTVMTGNAVVDGVTAP